MSFQTVDLVDAHQESVHSCAIQFRQFGAVRRFSGPIRTVKTREDNLLIRNLLATPGEGAVLVVDGEGSLRVALLGDVMATLAVQNGWAGLILWSAVRDSERLAEMQLGIKALGTNPMRSLKAGTGQVDVPVTFGGARFTPGSMLYSDDDGIVVSAVALR